MEYIKNKGIRSRMICIWMLSCLMIILFSSEMAQAAGDKYALIRQVNPGMTTDEVIGIMGEPDNIDQVTRWIFPALGQVVIRKEKIIDIRLGDQWKDKTPLYGKKQNGSSTENSLRYLRIGNHKSMVAEIAGQPEHILEGEDWYYAGRNHRIEISNGKAIGTQTNIKARLTHLDWVRLNFSKTSLLIMNITLAFIMFGVALEIRFDNFKQVLKEPKSLVLGVFSQFLALPALTFLMIWFMKPAPSIALGMILVASCPGGNISNFMSSLAKGNVALSISLTALATVSAVFMTPLNFAFWGNLYSETANMVIPIRIDFIEILRTVLILLGIPVVLGIWFAKQFPAITAKITKPLKKISMLIFLVFIVMALLGNRDFFKAYIHLIALLVFVHNGLALTTGFTIGTLGKIPRSDRRSLSIETGIQNSGLGLVLIFNPRLFDGLGGMAFVAAWWGIWHIISGLIISYFWSKKPLQEETLKPVKQEVKI
jgi:bile acid:Na+ symporter, BASS family